MDTTTFPVNIRVLGEDNLVLLDPDTGRITTEFPLRAGQQLVLRVITGEAAAFGFIANRRKAVSALRRSGPTDSGSYERRLPPVRDGETLPELFYPLNRVSIATVDCAHLVLHHFAVVEHRGELFLATNVRREALVRRVSGAIEAPNMEWNELFALIGHLFDPEVIPETVEPTPRPDLNELGTNQALVQWYDPTWGRGVAINENDEPVLVFANEVATREGHLPILHDGDVVSYRWMTEQETGSFTYALAKVEVLASVLW